MQIPCILRNANKLYPGERNRLSPSGETSSVSVCQFIPSFPIVSICVVLPIPLWTNCSIVLGPSFIHDWNRISDCSFYVCRRVMILPLKNDPVTTYKTEHQSAIKDYVYRVLGLNDKKTVKEIMSGEENRIQEWKIQCDSTTSKRQRQSNGKK